MVSWLSERLGQPVIIENRPGAGTNIAVLAVVNSPPDGYTLLFLGASAIVNTSMYENLPSIYTAILHSLRSDRFSHGDGCASISPCENGRRVHHLRQGHPRKISMASFGSGSASHLAGELFKLMAGVELGHVPYRGGAAMITDLVGGQVQVGFDVTPTSIPHIRTAALRALGVTNTKRYEGLPDVLSIAETVTGYEAGTWAGVPKGTPTSIILRLNREVNDGLANPAIRAKLADIGTIPMLFTPDEFGTLSAPRRRSGARWCAARINRSELREAVNEASLLRCASSLRPYVAG
jgi:tripartite-type tricarboxylate transporter receptor subunit TctC